MAELFSLVGKFVFDNAEGEKKMKGTTKEGEDMESKFSSSMKKIGAAIGGAFAVSKLKDFGQECINASNVQQQAELKLSTVMKQRMNASDKTIDSVKGLTSAQQKLGVVGDELQLSGAQQLSTFLNTSDSLKTLIPAMNDLAVQQNGCNVTSENMVSIGNLMGKVMNGQVGALSRVGISFTEAQEKVLKYGTEQEKAAMLAQVVKDNVGNMNEAFAKTDAGKVAQAKNKIGDLKEEIGAKLIPMQAKMYEKMSQAATYVTTKVLPAMGKIQKYVTQHKTAFKVLIGVVASLTSGFIAYKAAMAIQSTFNGVVNSVKGLITFLGSLKKAKEADTAVQEVNNAVMEANPIGLIIAAIAALVAAFVILWKKSEAFRNFWKGLWSGVKNIVSKAINGIKGFFTGIINFVKKDWKQLLLFIVNPFAGAFALLYKHNAKFRNAINSLIEGIKGAFTSFKNHIVGVFNGIKSVAVSVFNAIKYAITHPIQAAFSVIKGIIDKIKSVFHFSVSLPKIKLPHFGITPSGWKMGDLLKGKIPKLDIKWYASAMNNPVIMNKPTAFGINAKGNIMAGGEAGPEVVGGANTLMSMIRNASSESSQGISELLNRMFSFLQQYLPQLADMKLVLDDGTLVGKIMPQIDTGLGRIKQLKERGN